MFKTTQRKILVFSCIFILALAAILGFVIYDMRFAIREAIQQKSFDPLELKLEYYRDESTLLAWLVIGLIQMMQVVFLLPSEWIQVVGAICTDGLFAFSSCLFGVVLGNFAIYLSVKRIGPDFVQMLSRKRAAVLESISDSTPNKKRLILGIAALYFVPGIPYGLIAIIASQTGIGLLEYLILSGICSVPSIVMSVLLGDLVIRGSLVGAVAVVILAVLASVIFTWKRDSIMKFVSGKNSVKDYASFKADPGRFDKVFYALMALFFRLTFFRKYRVRVKRGALEEVKGPCVVLFNHPSFLDFIWVLTNLYPNKVHSVIAANFFYDYRLGRLLHGKGGGFPKTLFEPDVSAIQNIMRVIKSGGIVAFAPEGRLSPHGCLEAVNASTVGLLKKLGVDVILAKSGGSYLSKPKWAKKSRKGRIDVEYIKLFTAEELKATDAESLYQKLFREIYYDDFAWQEKNRVPFKCSAMAEGLENILYICPHCKKEFTLSTEKDRIRCSDCGFEAVLDPYYEFQSEYAETPKNIRDWFEMQKTVERERIKDEQYSMSCHVRLKMPHPKGRGLSEVGEGTALLDHTGLTYTGTINGEERQELFPISSMPALPFGAGEDFETYDNGTYYYFVPDEVRHCVKWSITEELMYHEYIKKNNIRLSR